MEKADIIHICTPNVFHHQFLPKDKKLIIEKPVAINSSSVPDIDACVCYQRRFDRQAKEVKALCEKKKPKRIKANIFVPRDPHYWECWRGDKFMSGGGALMNIGIHYLDLLIWWLGDDYKILEASTGFFQRSIDESAYAKLQFGDTIVDFNICARFHKRDIEYCVFWDKDYYIYDTDDATHLELLQGFLDGKYVDPKEAAKSLKLVEEIYDFSSHA